MELTNVVIKNNRKIFEANCNIYISQGDLIDETLSKIYNMLPNDKVQLQFRMVGANIPVHHTQRIQAHSLIFVKFTKTCPDDNGIYRLRFTQPEPQQKKFAPTSEYWQLALKGGSNSASIKIELWVEEESVLPHDKTGLIPAKNPFTFASLYEDTKLTDFELRGTDGAVCFHRVALAIVSPAVRRMLEEDDQPKAHIINIPDIPIATIQHLKDYIYLCKLPESGVEDLLLLASRYEIEDLEKHCVRKLVKGLTVQNAPKLLEFATKHNMMKLLIDILESAVLGHINIEEMRKHYHCTE